jgi:hypothetical protein
MPGKNPLVNPVNSRKQLLIAESELNRRQLVQEWQTMANNVCALANRARTISSFASAAASLVAGLAFFQRKKIPTGRGEKPSWWRTILKSAGLFSTFWLAFHPSGRGQKEK